MSAAPATIHLDYSPPLDWNFFINYLAGRLSAGVEAVGDGCYTRVVEIDGDVGAFTVTHRQGRSQLVVSVHGPVGRHSEVIGPRVRKMFDLDADPGAIRATLSADPWIGDLVATHPGIRIPGAWSLFELLVRTIVGQQVSVKAATTVMTRIVSRFGRRVPRPDSSTLERLFPQPAILADGDLTSIGMPTRRAQALRAVARAVADKTLDLDHTDQAVVRSALLALPGIGPWTVEYFALRGLRNSDAWPGSDLVLKRAIGRARRGALPATEIWRPYRAYAAMHLWHAAAPA